MKEITKRRILFCFICTVTVVILFVAVRINTNRINNKNEVSYINDYLSEIKYDEINEVTVENPNMVIYVSNSEDEKSIKFEEIFSRVIKKYSLDNNIFYININNANIVDPFYQNAPELIIYKNQEVKEVIDASYLNTNKKLVNALKERGIIND